MKKILVTGATGYIGSRIVQSLLQQGGIEIHLVVRPLPGQDRTAQLSQIWPQANVIKHILSLTELADLPLTDLTQIIHIAAATRFNITEEEALQSNVRPMQAIIQLAQKNKGLQQFVFASTVYASGKEKGIIKEEALVPSEFANYYESSKWECENLLMKSNLNWQIQRIATVIADNLQGKVGQLNAVHNTLKLFYYGLISIIPGIAATPIYLVNGDFVVQSMLQLMQKAPNRKFYHICQPKNQNMTLGQMIEDTFAIYLTDPKFKSRRTLKPLFCDLDSFQKLAKGVQGFQSGILSQAIGSISPFGEQLFIEKDILVDQARKYVDFPYPDQKKTFENAIRYLIENQFSIKPIEVN